VTVLAVALAGIVAVQLGVMAWLFHRALSDSDQQADTRVAVTQLEADVERLMFEIEGTRNTLAAERKRADVLEEIIADEINAPSDPPLSPSDVRSRLLRQARQWREASAKAVARASAGMPEEPPADGAATADVPVTRPSEL
jgi:hypothetical protein